MLVTLANLRAFFAAEQVRPLLGGQNEGHKGIKVREIFWLLRKSTASHVVPGEIFATNNAAGRDRSALQNVN